MNEREELIKKFSEASPVIEELIKYENKHLKNEDFKKRVIKRLLIPTMISLIIVGGSLSSMGNDSIIFPCFVLFPAVVLFCYILYRKKKKSCLEKIAELQGDSLLAFLPPNYHDLYSVTSIQTILVNCRASGLTDAINIYEQDLHNRIMELKQ